MERKGGHEISVALTLSFPTSARIKYLGPNLWFIINGVLKIKTFFYNALTVTILPCRRLKSITAFQYVRLRGRRILCTRSDSDFAECTLNDPILIPVLLSTFVTHPENVKNNTGLCSLKKLWSPLAFSKCRGFVNKFI